MSEPGAKENDSPAVPNKKDTSLVIKISASKADHQVNVGASRANLEMKENPKELLQEGSKGVGRTVHNMNVDARKGGLDMNAATRKVQHEVNVGAGLGEQGACAGARQVRHELNPGERKVEPVGNIGARKSENENNVLANEMEDAVNVGAKKSLPEMNVGAKKTAPEGWEPSVNIESVIIEQERNRGRTRWEDEENGEAKRTELGNKIQARSSGTEQGENIAGVDTIVSGSSMTEQENFQEKESSALNFPSITTRYIKKELEDVSCHVVASQKKSVHVNEEREKDPVASAIPVDRTAATPDPTRIASHVVSSSKPILTTIWAAAELGLLDEPGYVCGNL
jgi:hypothetical protein